MSWISQVAGSCIPTSDSLKLTSNPSTSNDPLPPSTVSDSENQQRDTWMLEPASTTSDSPSQSLRSHDIPLGVGTSSTGQEGMTNNVGNEEGNLLSGVDFFSTLGTEHKRKDPMENRPDPSKLVIDRRELNTQLVDGRALSEYEVKEKKAEPGGPGHQWRMMKLKRLYEQAEEQCARMTFHL